MKKIPFVALFSMALVPTCQAIDRSNTTSIDEFGTRQQSRDQSTPSYTKNSQTQSNSEGIEIDTSRRIDYAIEIHESKGRVLQQDSEYTSIENFGKKNSKITQGTFSYDFTAPKGSINSKDTFSPYIYGPKESINSFNPYANFSHPKGTVTSGPTSAGYKGSRIASENSDNKEALVYLPKISSSSKKSQNNDSIVSKRVHYRTKKIKIAKDQNPIRRLSVDQNPIRRLSVDNDPHANPLGCWSRFSKGFSRVCKGISRCLSCKKQPVPINTPASEDAEQHSSSSLLRSSTLTNDYINTFSTQTPLHNNPPFVSPRSSTLTQNDYSKLIITSFDDQSIKKSSTDNSAPEYYSQGYSLAQANDISDTESSDEETQGCRSRFSACLSKIFKCFSKKTVQTDIGNTTDNDFTTEDSDALNFKPDNTPSYLNKSIEEPKGYCARWARCCSRKKSTSPLDDLDHLPEFTGSTKSLRLDDHP